MVEVVIIIIITEIIENAMVKNMNSRTRQAEFALYHY